MGQIAGGGSAVEDLRLVRTSPTIWPFNTGLAALVTAGFLATAAPLAAQPKAGQYTPTSLGQPSYFPT